MYDVVGNEMVDMNRKNSYWRQYKFSRAQNEKIGIVLCHAKRLKHDEHYKGKWVVYVDGKQYAISTLYPANTEGMMEKSRKIIRGDYYT